MVARTAISLAIHRSYARPRRAMPQCSGARRHEPSTRTIASLFGKRTLSCYWEVNALTGKPECRWDSVGAVFDG
jgi:hypothetical protein